MSDRIVAPLTLLRHGESQAPLGCCVGQLDIPLHAAAHDATRQMAQAWDGPKPQRIVSSDLLRARQTAQIVAEIFQLPLVFDARLRELSFGEWEGIHWDEIYKRDPVFMARWGKEWSTLAPPAGESATDLFERVGTCRAELEAGSWVVAHAGSLAAMCCHHNGEPPERLFDYHFDCAQPVLLH